MTKHSNPFIAITIGEGYIKFSVVKDNPKGGDQLEYSGGQPYQFDQEPETLPPFSISLNYVIATCENWAGAHCSKQYFWEGVKPNQVVEYVNGKGLVCPVCGEDNGLEGDSVKIDAGGARQEMWCNVCDSDWTDIYSLVGISDLEEWSR